jgi:hypothetical protein
MHRVRAQGVVGLEKGEGHKVKLKLFIPLKDIRVESNPARAREKNDK